ncbi:type IV pilus modification PilV family protein [Thiocapsa imhoffii]|nr:hypothetical protein [Thiocapsa imhoffii]
MPRTGVGKTAGSILIEAIIALVILSGGLLAIAKLQGALVGSSGDSKARSEAAQFAGSRLDALRANFQTSTDRCAALLANHGTTTGTWTGLNTTFTWTETRTLVGTRLRVRQVVTWQDARAQAQTVTLVSEMSCEDPFSALNASRGGLAGPGLIKTPTGRASLPPNVSPLIAAEEGVSVIQHADGSETRIRGTRVQLVANETVVLQMESSTAGQGFSRVSGEVFIDKSYSVSGNNPDIDLQSLKVISSDSSLCVRIFKDNKSDFNTQWSAQLKPEAIDRGPYWSLQYSCYVGEGWYGNIGIVRLERAANKDRICVGDPAVAPTTFWSSRHRALSTIRKYRGYQARAVGTGYTAVGIGVNASYDPANETSQAYTATHLANQHFLLTPITGQPTDSACAAPMSRDGTSLFSGNLGMNVCISGVGTCPGEPNAEQTFLTVEGLIYLTPKQANAPTLLNIDTGECPLTSLKQKDDGNYSFECWVSRAGWTGESGSGEIEVVLADQTALCDWHSARTSSYARLDLGVDPPSTPKILLENVPSTEDLVTVDIQVRSQSVSCAANP